MEGLIQYKGYTGTVNFDKIDRLYYGKVLDIDEIITYEGTNMYLMQEAFHQAVDEFMELHHIPA